MPTIARTSTTRPQGSWSQVGTGGMPRGGYEPDRNNWAPRVGLGVDARCRRHRPYCAAATGSTTTRARSRPAKDCISTRHTSISVSTVPVPRAVPPVTLQDPFPQNYPVPVPTSATAYQRDLKTGWLEHWSVSVQRQLGGRRAVEVAYVGSRGHDLIAARDINQPLRVRFHPTCGRTRALTTSRSSSREARRITTRSR